MRLRRDVSATAASEAPLSCSSSNAAPRPSRRFAAAGLALAPRCVGRLLALPPAVTEEASMNRAAAGELPESAPRTAPASAPAALPWPAGMLPDPVPGPVPGPGPGPGPRSAPASAPRSSAPRTASSRTDPLLPPDPAIPPAPPSPSPTSRGRVAASGRTPTSMSSRCAKALAASGVAARGSRLKGRPCWEAVAAREPACPAAPSASMEASRAGVAPGAGAPGGALGTSASGASRGPAPSPASGAVAGEPAGSSAPPATASAAGAARVDTSSARGRRSGVTSKRPSGRAVISSSSFTSRSCWR